MASLSDTYMSHWYGTVLLFIVALAGVTGALAFTNYVARLLFEWGRDRHLPRVFARTHPRFDTPYVAVVVLGALSLLAYVFSYAWQGGSAAGGLTAFSWMYEVDAVLIAIIYPVVAIAASVVGHRAGASFLVRHIAPLLVIAVVGLSVKAQFVPIPDSPFNVAVYVAVAWLVVGILVRVVLRGRHTPGLPDERPDEDGRALHRAGDAPFHLPA